MKIKNMFMIGAVSALFATASARADHNWNWNDRFHYDRDSKDLFAANEFTLDLFGSYTDGKKKFNDTFDRSIRHGTFGGGVGANYFFTKNFGIGGDAIAQANGHDFVDAVSGSAILRLPIDEAHIAPYIFGGGGRQFDGPDIWNLHAGVGLEARLNPNTGIFVDGRHVFHIDHRGSDYLMLRAGLRLAF
jgi:hypothetical protein